MIQSPRKEKMRMLTGFLIVMVIYSFGMAEYNPQVMPLWPNGVPLRTPEQTADEPEMTVYLPSPETNTRAAVVIFPGGGYWALAMDHEGHQIAQWLNDNGIAGIIVTYRRGPGSQHPVPLTDAQHAIRSVRYHAQAWNIDPSKVGVLGFSAGGHLASTTGTHFDLGDSTATDSIEQQSCRPDFMVLLYPVISLNSEYTHEGSKRNLLGEDPDPELVESFSNDQAVTADTPPTFLVSTYEDKAVPCENSIMFFTGLRRAGVPGELHIFERGKHGLGLGKDDPAFSKWPGMCIEWLRTRKILD